MQAALGKGRNQNGVCPITITTSVLYIPAARTGIYSIDVRRTYSKVNSEMYVQYIRVRIGAYI